MKVENFFLLLCTSHALNIATRVPHQTNSFYFIFNNSKYKEKIIFNNANARFNYIPLLRPNPLFLDRSNNDLVRGAYQKLTYQRVKLIYK